MPDIDLVADSHRALLARATSEALGLVPQSARHSAPFLPVSGAPEGAVPLPQQNKSLPCGCPGLVAPPPHPGPVPQSYQRAPLGPHLGQHESCE